jgi:hypothetical protein
MGKARQAPSAKSGACGAYPELLLHIRQPLSPTTQQRSEWALDHGLSIGAEIFLVHCCFVRLARFGFHSDLGPQ